MIEQAQSLLKQLRDQGKISATDYHNAMSQARAANHEWLTRFIQQLQHRVGVAQ